MSLKSFLNRKFVQLKENKNYLNHEENLFIKSSLLYNDLGEYTIYNGTVILDDFFHNLIKGKFINNLKTAIRLNSTKFLENINRNYNTFYDFFSSHNIDKKNMNFINFNRKEIIIPELKNSIITNMEIKAYIDRIFMIEDEIKRHENKELKKSLFKWQLLLNDGGLKVFEHRFIPSKLNDHNAESVIYFDKSDIEQNEYYVTGFLKDVTLNDLLFVYYDIETHKSWDKYSKKIDVIHYDSSAQTDIINWVISNFLPFRQPYQYIFCRRIEFKPDTKTCYILSRSIKNPKEFKIINNIMSKDAKYVGKYKSILKLEAIDNINNNGLIFSMLYYEESGKDDYKYPTMIAAKVVANTVKTLHSATISHVGKNQKSGKNK